MKVSRLLVGSSVQVEFALLKALLSGFSLWCASEFTNDARCKTNDVWSGGLDGTWEVHLVNDLYNKCHNHIKIS